MASFYELSPDRVLDDVEAASRPFRGEVRATGRTWALNSIENRVYEIELEDGRALVAKFYRPQRWSAPQILDEQKLCFALAEAEVPAVTPLALAQGPGLELLGPHLARNESGIFFALFPKVRGKSRDELPEEDLKVLGRLLGRLHRVARSVKLPHRRRLDAQSYGWDSLKFLLAGESFWPNPGLCSRYEQAARALCQKAETGLKELAYQPVHGDCHLGNLLWNETGPFFVDFDDSLHAPPVQDLWMIVNGRDDFARRARDTLLSAYEQMNEFDEDSLASIELLRGLRLMHYSAWIARRWEDPSFPRMFPHFASEKYWVEEIEALMGCLEAWSLGGSSEP